MYHKYMHISKAKWPHGVLENPENPLLFGKHLSKQFNMATKLTCFLSCCSMATVLTQHAPLLKQPTVTGRVLSVLLYSVLVSTLLLVAFSPLPTALSN